MGSARWVSKRAHGYPEVEVGKSRVNIKVILSFDSLASRFRTGLAAAVQEQEILAGQRDGRDLLNETLFA